MIGVCYFPYLVGVLSNHTWLKLEVGDLWLLLAAVAVLHLYEQDGMMNARSHYECILSFISSLLSFVKVPFTMLLYYYLDGTVLTASTATDLALKNTSSFISSITSVWGPTWPWNLIFLGIWWFWSLMLNHLPIWFCKFSCTRKAASWRAINWHLGSLWAVLELLLGNPQVIASMLCSIYMFFLNTLPLAGSWKIVKPS